MLERSAGLLLPAASLPGGRLGPQAERFIDFLASARQRFWQLLPLGPSGPGRSPYAAKSAFAGAETLLDPSCEIPEEGLAEFRHAQRGWLADYALYRALSRTHRGSPWTRWPKPLRDREPEALHRARERHAKAVTRTLRLQHAFDRRWMEIKRYANARGVRLIGDLPLFVAHDSADVWTHRELFELKPSGAPRVVAGVPPDYFSLRGQLWGNPHYRWDRLRKRRYAWWIARLRRACELFDVLRLDHFLGYLRAWQIPAGARSAAKGRWARGPGTLLFQAVRRALGPRPMIAEDLGLKTPEAEALRKRFGLFGMRILQFSFGGDPEELPHRFPRDCAVYTGTHDNNTTRGWFEEGGPDRERARRYAGCRKDRIAQGLVRVAHLSPADLAIVPVQDLLGLDAGARINRPGTSRGNWRWRLEEGALTSRLARRLADLTEVAGR